ncbi:transcriptional regulator [Methylobacterium sp. J-059]|uniref:transcriptional regulator n=1 Tax=Methylobacterium sp. J-059 TaxID=2836643 RepID=UPI001FB865D9|nr:transcriptional regulator [Methylobacterium sp. J-059]MCJ2039541.1 transcriptional regulator [Methylobacterium sp. J-059]
MFDYWDRLNAEVTGEVEAKRNAVRRALDHEHQAGRLRRSHGTRKRWNINTQRIAEIGKIVLSRHDGPCDTDDAELYLQIALPHFIKLHSIAADLRIAVDAWTATLLPKLARSRAVEMTEEAEAREWRFASPDEVAKLLNVVLTERSNLGLKTIGAIDRTKQQRKADRKKRDAEYQARKRVSAGATPRSASNVAQAKALGISLSTLKRRLKAGLVPTAEKGPDPISSALVRRTHLTTTKTVHPSIQTAQGPARTARPRHSVGADGPTPGAKTRAVPPGRAVPLPLPIGGVSEQPDLMDGLGEWRQVGAPLIAYEGGPLPPELARAVREALRVRTMTQGALARQVGVSRPQIVNVLQGRFGLSRSAAANLMSWLAAA